MVDFRNIMYNLEMMGFDVVILPFLLVFTIVFAVLQKAKLFGKDQDGNPVKKYNVVVAFIMGLLFVIPSTTGRYPQHADPVQIINQALPGVAIIAIAAVMVLLLLGVFGFKFKEDNAGFNGILGFFAIGAVAFIFLIAAGVFERTWRFSHRFNFLYDPQMQALITIILVFGLITYFIVRDSPNKNNNNSNTNWKILKSITEDNK